MPLTKQQKKAYLKHSHKCPFCGSIDIEGGFCEINEGRAYQTVTCNDCSKSWSDCYELVDVEEIE